MILTYSIFEDADLTRVREVHSSSGQRAARLVNAMRNVLGRLPVVGDVIAGCRVDQLCTDQDLREQHAIDGVIPDRTPITDPDDDTVGKEFGGHDFEHKEWKGVRWFCFSHDHAGYWMYATDGSGHWTNVSGAAIGRSFHEIYTLEPGGKPMCGWFRNGVPPYVQPESV